jgi:RND family efflux transporter MFP subunit
MRNVILSFLVIVALAACNSNANSKKEEPKNDPIPVTITPITPSSKSSQIKATGLISTEDEARLSFKITGVVEKVFVKEGQFVKKGQLLASLKSTEISAQVGQVQLSLEKAKRDYQRASNLYKDSVATLEQMQNAKTGVDIAERNLQQVAFNQQYSKIYAVSDGFIIKQLLNEGELANSGSPVLYMSSVSGSSKWILKIGVSDKEWAAIEKGNSAYVIVDAFTDKQFKAVVSKKALAADPVSGSFEIELQVDFEKSHPAIGMFGNATITPSGLSAGFSIPYDALLEAHGKNGFVFVTDDKKTVKRIPITIGSIDNRQVYVADGLQGHQWVIISGSAYLDEQSLITVK